MDRFVKGATQPKCSDARNFAYADEKTVGGYWDLARKYAMGDRVFQSIAGASSANNMYYVRGKFVFLDNAFESTGVGGDCAGGPFRQYYDTTIGDLLNACGVSWTFYAEGYRQAAEAHPKCVGKWPQAYDPGDIPIAYYPSLADKPEHMQDYEELKRALKENKLPAVTFVKSVGFRSEHPKDNTISAGVAFSKDLFQAVTDSAYAKNTLVIVTPDEGGGYFDHIPPPGKSSVDGKEYGVRIFLLALGEFAKTNYISHVPMEHTSLIRFIEWNWLGGEPGQLGTRDAAVHNIGSLLNAAKTGTAIPE
jgi:phospholipase C